MRGREIAMPDTDAVGDLAAAVYAVNIGVEGYREEHVRLCQAGQMTSAVGTDLAETMLTRLAAVIDTWRAGKFGRH